MRPGDEGLFGDGESHGLSFSVAKGEGSRGAAGLLKVIEAKRVCDPKDMPVLSGATGRLHVSEALIGVVSARREGRMAGAC